MELPATHFLKHALCTTTSHLSSLKPVWRRECYNRARRVEYEVPCMVRAAVNRSGRGTVQKFLWGYIVYAVPPLRSQTHFLSTHHSLALGATDDILRSGS